MIVFIHHFHLKIIITILLYLKMSFKTKNKIKKKEDFDTRVTLEDKYNEKLNKFDFERKNIIKKKKELKRLEVKYNLINIKKNIELSEEEMKLKLSIFDKINVIKKYIKNNETNKDIEYFLETGDLLFKYYENKRNVAEGKNIKINNIKTENTNKKSVMEYFKSNITNLNNCNDNSNDNGAKNKNNDNHLNDVNNKNNDNNLNDVNDEEYLSKSNIYEKYMSKIDINYVINNENNIDICKTCLIEKTLFISCGKLICLKCGEETPILIDSDKPSYKDPPREVCYFAYKRINHFNEWLAQFQAKESTDIPQSVYNDILIELKKERIHNIKDLTPFKLREILKKLKKNKYYEHIPHIINKLNGVPPPIMNRKTEEELRRMFKEIQIPFHKYCPPSRKNFLSYSYVLHKFVQLLELDEFLPCFLLLKSREKLQQQDQIWRQICDHLNWQFIPSL